MVQSIKEDINLNANQVSDNNVVTSIQNGSFHKDTRKNLQYPSPQMSPTHEALSTPTLPKFENLVADAQAEWAKAQATPMSAPSSSVQPEIVDENIDSIDYNNNKSNLFWEEPIGSFDDVGCTKEHPFKPQPNHTGGGLGLKIGTDQSKLFNTINSVSVQHQDFEHQQNQQHISQPSIGGSTLAEEYWPPRNTIFPGSDVEKETLYQASDFADTSGNAHDLSDSYTRYHKRKLNPPRKRRNTRAKKGDPNRPTIKRWTESDDDKVAFLREYGNLKWHEVTEFINGRHTPQAVQMRYLRSLKKRNDSLTFAEKEKLQKIVKEDYENRFKRISTQMGPSFTQVRIQKILLMEAGLGELLKEDKVWTKEEIAKFVDEAAGDFDNFEVPYRADRLPSRAADYMMHRMSRPYHDLVDQYVGRVGTLYSGL